MPHRQALSQRIRAVQDPIIPIVGEWTRNNPGTISLGQGMVAYGPPPAALEKIQHSLQQTANHRYGPAQGSTQLRQGIEAKLLSDNRIDCNRGYQVVVTAGSNMAFLNAIMAITDPGDEIILPLPYYFNQEMAITMADCTAITVPTDSAYQLDIAAIRRAISDKTRAVVTISPNNPTGAVYSKQALQNVNQLCKDFNLYHISDEAYEYFTYGGARHYSPAAFDDAEQHTISLYSLSKAYGFAGWRIGYMVVPEALYPAILKVQDTNLICPPMISQSAALGCLETGKDYCKTQLQQIEKTRNTVINLLQSASNLVETQVTGGAFYLLLNVDTDADDLMLVQKLITDFKVAAIPGSAFGLTNGCHLRIAYAMLDEAAAEAGITRLIDGLQSLC